MALLLLLLLLLSRSKRRPIAEAIEDTVLVTPPTTPPIMSPASPLLAASAMPLTAEVSVVVIELTSVRVQLAACESLLLPKVLTEEATDGTSTRKTSVTDCTNKGSLGFVATSAG